MKEYLTDEDFQVQPHNGQEGEPCPYGCIFTKKAGKVALWGDCRAPWSDECYCNKNDKYYIPKGE